MLQVVVGPRVDDLIEGAEIGVPEGPQARVLFPERLPLGEALFEVRDGAGAQRVRTHFVDHARLLLWSMGRSVLTCACRIGPRCPTGACPACPASGSTISRCCR